MRSQTVKSPKCATITALLHAATHLILLTNSPLSGAHTLKNFVYKPSGYFQIKEKIDRSTPMIKVVIIIYENLVAR